MMAKLYIQLAIAMALAATLAWKLISFYEDRMDEINKKKQNKNRHY